MFIRKIISEKVKFLPTLAIYYTYKVNDISTHKEKRMYKNIILAIIAAVVISGCGGGSAEEADGTKSSHTQAGGGKYALWDYLVPSVDKTNNYIKTTATSTQKYQTRFVKTGNTVTETSDYAKNEQTIYTKNKTNITVSFLKDGAPNGRYDLKLYVDIDDIVTVKKSDCRLTKHYDTYSIDGENFNDVIEITCGNEPGFYQKGVGEIAQKRSLSTSGKVDIKILSN